MGLVFTSLENSVHAYPCTSHLLVIVRNAIVYLAIVSSCWFLSNCIRVIGDYIYTFFWATWLSMKMVSAGMFSKSTTIFEPQSCLRRLPKWHATTRFSTKSYYIFQMTSSKRGMKLHTYNRKKESLFLPDTEIHYKFSNNLLNIRMCMHHTLVLSTFYFYFKCKRP